MLTFITLTTVLTLAVLCYSLYKVKFNDFFKLLSLPLVLLLATLMGFHYLDRLGAPIDAYPTGKWQYEYHKTDGKTIVLSITELKGYRTYTFPYSEETREALEKAKEQKSMGIKLEGEFKPAEPNPRGGQTSKSELQFHIASNNFIKTGG